MMRFLVVAFLFYSCTSFAKGYEETLQYLNIYHSDEVTKVVQVVDPSAGVQVQIKPKYRELSLPFSGLPTKEFVISKSNGRPEVESISIKIFSEYVSLPQNILAEVENLFSWTEVKPEIPIR